MISCPSITCSGYCPLYTSQNLSRETTSGHLPELNSSMHYFVSNQFPKRFIFYNFSFTYQIQNTSRNLVIIRCFIMNLSLCPSLWLIPIFFSQLRVKLCNLKFLFSFLAVITLKTEAAIFIGTVGECPQKCTIYSTLKGKQYILFPCSYRPY